MKIRKLILFVPLLFLFACSHSGGGKKVASSGELMWKIEKEGLPGVSYLFGTIHLMPKDDFFMPQDAVTALEASKALVLEVDVDMTVKEQVALAQKMLLSGGETYQDYMSEDDYKILRSYMLDTIGLKEAKVDRYLKIKPMFLMGVILTEYYEDVVMYEKEFSAIAKKKDIPLLEMEGVDYQLNLMDSIGLLMDFPTPDELTLVPDFEKLMKVYKTKNLNDIFQMAMSDIDPNDPDDVLMEDVLFRRRNNEWIPKIEKMVVEQPVFIAVGCGHLGGDYGIVKQLQAEGYTLTPMPF